MIIMHKRTEINVSCNTAIFYYRANLSEGFFQVSSKNYNKIRNNRKKNRKCTPVGQLRKKAMAKTVAQTLKLSVPKTSPFQPTDPSIATTFYCLGQSLSPFTLQFSCIIINLYVYFCLPYGKRCSPGVCTSLLI